MIEVLFVDLLDPVNAIEIVVSKVQFNSIGGYVIVAFDDEITINFQKK